MYQVHTILLYNSNVKFMNKEGSAKGPNKIFETENTRWSDEIV